jgi:hypothetical protein
MAEIKSTKDRVLARTLRVVEKKTFREISALTGISIGTLHAWSKKEGWPDPEKERRELSDILAGQAPGNSPGKTSTAGQFSQKEKALAEWILPDNLPEVSFDKSMEETTEQVYFWALQVVQKAAHYSVPTAIKLLEITSRTAVALHTPKPGENRKLTIMIPAQAESYRDPPPEDE